MKYKSVLLLFFVTILPSTFGYVIKARRCLYTKNKEISEQTFNTFTQICCGKSGVHDKYHKGQKLDCCGERTYNPRLQLCHGEIVISCGNYSEIQNSTSNVLMNTTKHTCCGNKVYSPLKQTCLNGVIKNANGRKVKGNKDMTRCKCVGNSRIY